MVLCQQGEREEERGEEVGGSVNCAALTCKAARQHFMRVAFALCKRLLIRAKVQFLCSSASVGAALHLCVCAAVCLCLCVCESEGF